MLSLVNYQSERGNDIASAVGLSRSIINAAQLSIIIYIGAAEIMTSGGMTIGMLVAYLAYRGIFSDRFSALNSQINQFRFIGLHLERSSEIISTDIEFDIDDASCSPPVGDIELRDVSFSYDTAYESGGLGGVNVLIRPGEFVSITGPSGSGKTTLVKLLSGLYTPTSGEILIGGKRLSNQEWRRWRQHVGIATQSDPLFRGSIKDNICFGRPYIETKLVKAATMAGIHDEIIAMSLGYETPVNDMNDAMSAGQRQRVLLARALYRDPVIIILDEITANLDEANEIKIANVLAGLAITRIVVSHRPELVECADVHYTVMGGTLNLTWPSDGRSAERPVR